jgi:hypothetical protein
MQCAHPLLLVQSCQHEYMDASKKLELVKAQLTGMENQLQTIQDAKAQLLLDLNAAQKEECRAKHENSCIDTKYRAALVKISDLENALRLQQEGANATRVQLAVAHEVKVVQDQELQSCNATLLDAQQRYERLKVTFDTGQARERGLENQLAKFVPLPCFTHLQAMHDASISWAQGGPVLLSDIVHSRQGHGTNGQLVQVPVREYPSNQPSRRCIKAS